MEALDAAAVRLSTAEGEVRREGQHLVLKAPPTPIDPEVLTVDEAIRLLRRRARDMWSPRENWMVVGGITSLGTIAAIGVLIAAAPGIAFIGVFAAVAGGFIAIGQRVKLNRKYLELARADYPILADAADGQLPPEVAPAGSAAQP